MRLVTEQVMREVAPEAHRDPPTVAKLHGVYRPTKFTAIQTKCHDGERCTNDEEFVIQTIDVAQREVP